jgi:hypothetical protein
MSGSSVSTSTCLFQYPPQRGFPKSLGLEVTCTQHALAVFSVVVIDGSCSHTVNICSVVGAIPALPTRISVLSTGCYRSIKLGTQDSIVGCNLVHLLMGSLGKANCCSNHEQGQQPVLVEPLVVRQQLVPHRQQRVAVQQVGH